MFASALYRLVKKELDRRWGGGGGGGGGPNLATWKKSLENLKIFAGGTNLADWTESLLICKLCAICQRTVVDPELRISLSFFEIRNLATGPSRSLKPNS